jgi:hypothetical protein
MTISQGFQFVSVVLMITAPALVLPLLFWMIIHFMFRADPLERLAGPFTLKPVIATILWAVILQLNAVAAVPAAVVKPLTVIPGIGLTLLIVWANLDLFRGEPKWAWILLVMDTLRWLSSFLWLEFDGSIAFTGPLFWLAMGLPSIFAIMAIGVMWNRRQVLRRTKAPISSA